MKFIQFYTLSTGYVAGSIPPRFSDEHKRPIEMLGSDGVMVLDQRLGTVRCQLIAIHAMREKPQYARACGYRIMQGPRFSDARPVCPYMPRVSTAESPAKCSI